MEAVLKCTGIGTQLGMIFLFVNLLAIVCHSSSTTIDTSVTHFYLGYFANYFPSKPSVTIIVNEIHPVSYSIEIPGIGYSTNGVIAADDNDVVITLPSRVVVSSIEDQNNGVYITTNSSTTTVIGQNYEPSTSDTFLVSPNSHFSKCKYYGISEDMSLNEHDSYLHSSSMLIVGAESSTLMNLTVTKEVTICVHDVMYYLTPGTQYTFVINRLETILIRSLEDLTGTKVVTDKPVSVFSGHRCGLMFKGNGPCDHMVEQILPTKLWGKVFYIAPLATRRSYFIKVLAIRSSTIVDIYCNNSMTSYAINAGEFIFRKYTDQEYCSIHANNKILVVQFSPSPGDDSTRGDVMMTMVPAVSQYTNQFSTSTSRNLEQSDFKHFVNVIVLAQYYQPDMIYLISGGVNKSLDTQEWVPVKVNNVIEAYATKVAISEGLIEITHTNASALMITSVYGFAREVGYGHPGGLWVDNCKVSPDSPIKVISHPKSVTVEAAGKAVFQCVVKGCGIKYVEWKKLGSQLPVTAIVSNIVKSLNTVTSTLEIDESIGYYKGNYYCSASNDDGIVNSTVAYLNVSVRCAEIIRPPISSEVVLGETATFHCLAWSYGRLVYDWEKNGTLILPSTSVQSFQKWSSFEGIGYATYVHQLTVPNVQPSNEGLYCCLAINECGVTRSCAWLKVKKPPIINFITSNSVVFEGSKVILSCNVTNEADVTTLLKIDWYNSEGVRVESDDKHIPVYSTTDPVTGQVQSVLLFDPVNHSDSGEYTCHAFNDVDCYTEDKTNLIVEYSPIITVTPGSPFSASVGEQVTIMCKAEGLPTPTLQWYKDTKECTAGISLLVLNVPTDTPHTAVYTCVSRNRAGGQMQVTKTDITVIVQTKCQPLDHPSNGHVLHLNDGKIAVFYCNTGYTLTGPIILQCSGGRWNSPPPACIYNHTSTTATSLQTLKQ